MSNKKPLPPTPEEIESNLISQIKDECDRLHHFIMHTEPELAEHIAAFRKRCGLNMKLAARIGKDGDGPLPRYSIDPMNSSTLIKSGLYGFNF